MNAILNPHETLRTRAETIYLELDAAHTERTNRLFAWLMLAQWAFGILLAFTVSPYAWAGRTSSVHVHVWAAILLGGALSALPAWLGFRRASWGGTKHVLACSQVMWSALFIHLTGGRIETHFHVFGSLAFIAFYRDWKVLIAPTILVAGDHLVRGVFWPESVYGFATTEYWRFLEHAAWVVFEDTILVFGCVNAQHEMHAMALRRAEVEELSVRERERTAELDRVLGELRSSQAVLVRTEKLAAVGQLAASVGHELRNPLSAVRNATTYIRRKVGPQAEPRIGQMLDVADRELEACAKIIGDLLDYARERPLALTPSPLRPLVEETIGVIQNPRGVPVRNDVCDELPAPLVDRDLFRQVLANLVQNAVEATQDGAGEVVVHAEGGLDRPFRITVSDSGVGIPADVALQVFEPLFTTKTKGTGLGLAIVANMVKRHGGTVAVDSEVGRGSRFTIEIPHVVESTAA